ncbi:hypothetical protein FQ185_18820 [Pseudomonas sp. ANT_H12B]|nr:hypothetical protein FQ185_18820 [Pseudomonas sp. ANT_H12B]
MGASLLAKRPCQSTLMVTDKPLSRAGSLPQGIVVGQLSVCPSRHRVPRCPFLPARAPDLWW